MLLVRLAINKSTIPDRLVAPLLLDDSSAAADAIVVLGAGVTGPCTPNLNGVRRILLAARLFKESRAPVVVITGGSSDRHCPVAEAMARVAVECGVPADRMLVESDSHSTNENGERTAPLLRSRQVSRVLLVTDRLHMRRAVGVFQRLGFRVEPAAVPIYEGHEDNVSMLSAGIREAAALAYYRLRGWTAPAATGDEDAVARNTGAVGTAGGTQRSQTGGIVSGPASTDTRPVVILGASYAANWKLADLDGVPVVNAGVPGQQSFEMASRFESDVAAARPRAVVLWGFINDLFRASDVQQSLARMRTSYAEMTKRARAAGIEPIVATEVTIRPPKTWLEPLKSTVAWWLGKQSYQDVINRHVTEGNQWLREFAGREGILVLDFQGTLADRDGRRARAFATDDGSHISPAGYRALTEYARPILSARLRSANRSGTTQR